MAPPPERIRDAESTVERDPSVALYATAVLGAVALGPRGPLYWDSFGYVEQAITGRVGGLALGRPLFVLTSHALAVAWLALAHGAPRTLEPLLRAFWLGIAALSAPLTARLARALGGSARAALFAGVAVALSPAMAHASSAVLTDAPSLALTLLAFVLGARAVHRDAPHPLRTALAAGAALGVAFGLREQACAQAAVLALMLPCAPRPLRARTALAMTAGFALVALAPLAYVALTQPAWPASVTGWLRAMSLERASHPRSWRTLLAYGAWLVALGPAAFALALASVARLRRTLFAWPSLTFAVVAPSLAQLLLLAFYQDISYSPRYLLPALPGAIALPAALYLDQLTGDSRRRYALALAALMLPLVLAAPVVRAREAPLRRAIDTLPMRLASVPAGSVIVTGQLCPAVALDQRVAHAGPWQRVCPGWSWPCDLPRVLDGALREGHTVVLDLREVAWVGSGQQASLGEVSAYASAHASDVARGAVVLWR